MLSKHIYWFKLFKNSYFKNLFLHLLLLLNSHLIRLIPPNHRNSWRKWGLFKTRMPKSSHGKIWSLSFKDHFCMCWFPDLLDALFLLNVLQLSQRRICFIFPGCEYQFCLEYNTAILRIKSTQIVNGAGFFRNRYEQWVDLRSSGNICTFLVSFVLDGLMCCKIGTLNFASLGHGDGLGPVSDHRPIRSIVIVSSLSKIYSSLSKIYPLCSLVP